MPLSSPRHTRHYWDVWPDKVMRERFVHDWDDWQDFQDNSLTSRNRRSELARRSDDQSKNQVLEDKTRFRVKLDVSHFKPWEVEVKYADNNIVVTGKHEEVEDKQGWVSRQFSRRYALPEEYDSDLLNSSLTADGVLVIEAPVIKPVRRVTTGERVVPITHTHHITRNGSK